MADFSGKIVDAQYIDSEYSVIKVLYEDNNVLNVYNLNVNPEHPDYQALEAEGWDHNKLVDSTAAVKKAQAAAFAIEVNAAAKALIEQNKVNTAAKALIEQNMENEIRSLEKLEDYFELFVADTDKDNLFKFKLWALENSIMQSATKEEKSKIRKASSILEGLSILYDIKSK